MGKGVKDSDGQSVDPGQCRCARTGKRVWSFEVTGRSHGHPLKEGATRPMMDYEKIRHAAKTGDKIMELATSLGLDPARHTIKDLADMLLQKALIGDDAADTPARLGA